MDEATTGFLSTLVKMIGQNEPTFFLGILAGLAIYSIWQRVLIFVRNVYLKKVNRRLMIISKQLNQEHNRKEDIVYFDDSDIYEQGG